MLQEVQVEFCSQGSKIWTSFLIRNLHCQITTNKYSLSLCKVKDIQLSEVFQTFPCQR